MSARLTLDERAELDRLRRLSQELAEELSLWRAYGRPKAPKQNDLWGCELGFPPAEALLLAELVEAAPEAVGREQLMMATSPTWLDAANEPEPKIIDVYLCRIRKRLDAMGYPGAIRTHWGFGYSMTSKAAAKLRPQQTENAA